MGGVGVAIVVATIDARLPDRCSPELLDVGQVLARDIAREEVLASRVLLENAGRQARSGCAERQVLSASLLGLVGRFDPDASIQVEVSLSGAQHLPHSGAGEQLQPNGVCGALVRM